VPRPEPNTITFTLDGLEVQAPENSMLVDAAKRGDVEIPVFCYEPKLGSPVGACRMCLVEIEGIPKLQTGCSTPVKDGMVVHTQSERVKTAQNAVVEFLLINHPLDCPVCDKGGECPLQDIAFGWGLGTSRFIEPKRHFVKPLELSPLIAIDRERCILCYRCVRFSQEISEDYQLVLLERGTHSYVSTFDGHPYVAPFSGNIVELCPVGALTSRAYRFRARPWDVEDSGSVCTLCPAQCNVTFTVRDERVERVLARENTEVDDGWLCDKGRFAYQAIHADQRVTQPLVRDGGELRPVSWERALDEAAAGLQRARGRVAALAGEASTSEEGLLLARLLREGLGSGHVDTLAALDPGDLHRLAAPDLQATVGDLEFAHQVLVVGTEPVRDIPILDLRIRKGVRRHGVKLALATPQRSTLDVNAALALRYAPGADGDFLRALAAALAEQAGDGGGESAAPAENRKAAGDSTAPADSRKAAGDNAAPADSSKAAGEMQALAQAAGVDPEQVRALAKQLRAAGEEIVILYGQRALAHGGAQALEQLADTLHLRGRDGAGLLAVPAGGANGRGLFEAGVAPGYGPGLRALASGDERGDGDGDAQPLGTHRIAQALAAGQLSALYLLHADPLRAELPREQWQAALEQASTVIAHAGFLTDGVREYATVVFPAESYAEKEGTVVHPDGRLQRLRPAIARQGQTRAEWSVLAELARRCGEDLGVLSGPMASQQLFEAVPFYAGLTLEQIGGRGVRWQERPEAAAFPAPPARAAGPGANAPGEAGAAPRPGADERAAQPIPAGANGACPPPAPASLWDAPEVEFSPSLRFLYDGVSHETPPRDEALAVGAGAAADPKGSS
jgi:NADH-quinone oxidoreductase subunit G